MNTCTCTCQSVIVCHYDSNESLDNSLTDTSTPCTLLGKYTNNGTVSSLKSLDNTRAWTDINPFSNDHDDKDGSTDDMSVLIELDDDTDHVWNGLKMIKNKPESKL